MPSLLFPCSIWEESDVSEAPAALCEALQGLKGPGLDPARSAQTVLTAGFGTGSFPVDVFGAAARVLGTEVMRETGSISLGVLKLLILAALLTIKGGGSGGKGSGSPPSTEVGFSATGSLRAGQGGGLRGLVWLAEGRGCSGWWDPICGHPWVRD